MHRNERRLRPRRRHNLAARAGRWSATHRKAAIWGWVAFVVAALALGGTLGTKTLSDSQSGVGESAAADRRLESAFPEAATESVLVQSRRKRASAPGFRAAVAGVEARLSDLPFVRELEGPYGPGADGRVSADGHSALVQFEIPENARVDPQEKVGTALAAVAATQRAHPRMTIEEVGDASAEKAISDNIGEDFSKAEGTSLPVTLLILLVVFGSLVAAGVPLLLALSAVAATIGLLGPVSHVLAQSPNRSAR